MRAHKNITYRAVGIRLLLSTHNTILLYNIYTKRDYV